MSSGLGEAIGKSLADTFAFIGCACLVVGILLGVVATRACSSGWRVQSPIARPR